jgi:2'-5' RNA ligase
MRENQTPFEIVPHPIRGTNEPNTERIVLVAAEIRAAEGATDERPIIEITSTSTGEDRHGSRIFEWDDSTFMRTGHVLWQHDVVPAYPFVGKKLSSKQVGDRSISQIELLVNLWRHMNCNLAAFLWEAFRDHGMGAMSRAFIPLQWKRRDAKLMPTALAENIDYEKVEQTEESFVNVPSNRDSFARAIERKRTAGTFNDQLGRMLGYDIPTIVLSTAKETRMPTRTVETFRSELAATLKRCCGCEPYREPKPEMVTPEQQAADIETMTTVAKAQLASLDAAIAGWKVTANDSFRGMLSSVAVGAMYLTEGLIWRAKEWYGVELAISVPDTNAADAMQQIIASADVPARSSNPVNRAAATAEQRKETRGRIAEALRCGGCDPYIEQKPTLPADEATKAAECATRVYEAMYWFDMIDRWLSDWYGAEVSAVPLVDFADVTRALEGVRGIIDGTRAGAVFSKKNLEKIDQVISIMGDLRAAANKPTAADLPDEARRAPAVTETRAEGPFDFASTQVNLTGDAEQAVLDFGAQIPDDVLGEKGRETTPHVTISFGLDPAVTADQVREVLANSDSIKELVSRGASLTLGATAIFTSEPGSHANGDDVVYIAVNSEDLVLLNKIITEELKVTSNFEYVPHVTVAYVKSGEGEKFAGDETLSGTVVPFDSIAYSDVDGNLTEIPLAAAVQSRGLRIIANPDPQPAINIRIKDTGGATREQVAASQPIRVLAPDTARGRAADGPTQERPLYVSLLSE